MKAEDSKNEIQVTGSISETGKTFVGESDGKSWTIVNPDAVKGHEGHHVILTANCDADKNEVHVVSLRMVANHDNMKAEDSKNEVQVTGSISETGKTFVGESDGKSWTIVNPDAVKGHEGHHVILTANFDADKNEVRVVSLKMAK
jgi:uncharacterized protein Veg